MILGKNTWNFIPIYLYKQEDIFPFNVYIFFYREILGFQINSVGFRFRAAKHTDIKLLFVNNLKDRVEIFLINFKAVTYKGNQKRLLTVCVYG